MKKIKVLVVFGTRPEAVKMAPLIKKLETNDSLNLKVAVTAQHREMLDQVLEIFDIRPDYDLDIMKEKQSLSHITKRALIGIEEILKKEKPDVCLVHGDTTTSFAASLACFYNGVKVGHVEAGLRTFNKYLPYPEEMNRLLTGKIADFHFAPTKNNKENLVKEGIKENVYVTGNTAIDALQYTVEKKHTFKDERLNNIDFEKKKVLLMTAHRRENLGKPLVDICRAARNVVENNKDVILLYAVHLNPLVQNTALKLLSDHDRIILTEPLDILDMHNVMRRSYFVLSDSGGLQEEAPAMGKPVLVLRNETERQEAIEMGTVKLTGTKYEDIIRNCKSILKEKATYEKMAKDKNMKK